MPEIDYRNHKIKIETVGSSEVLTVDGQKIDYDKLEKGVAIRENIYAPKDTLLEAAKAYVDDVLVR